MTGNLLSEDLLIRSQREAMSNLVPFILQMGQANHASKELAANLQEFTFTMSTKQFNNYGANSSTAGRFTSTTLNIDEAASRDNDLMKEEQLNDLIANKARENQRRN